MVFLKLKISLTSKKNICLKTGFKYLLQALIYNLLDRVDSDWLHSTGFKYEKRTFKLFTFSSFLEKPIYKRDKKMFIFQNEVSFVILSPVEWVIKQLANNIILQEKIKIGINEAYISGIEIISEVKIKSKLTRIKTVTPIEVHSTLLTKDGKKKTYYYSPSENDFSKLINLNLKKKWASFFNEDCIYNIKIRAVKIEKCREHISSFKNIIIKAWSGHFYIEGDEKLIEFALNVGLGSRNSNGYGMIEVI